MVAPGGVAPVGAGSEEEAMSSVLDIEQQLAEEEHLLVWMDELACEREALAPDDSSTCSDRNLPALCWLHG